MSWAGIAINQCVSLNNLRDAIANSIFIAKTTVPAGTKQITKTEALAYVDIQTSPLSSKTSSQLVVKNNLSAVVYTYNRYDLDTTICVTSNPIPFWSYYNIPYGSYNLNGTANLYQIIPTTHTTFTNEITSYVSTTCTPVTRYTYSTVDVNQTTCATSNPQQWWSYNNYANGYYFINGPGTLYSLSSSSHTNYTNQITSVTGGTCGSPTYYYYNVYDRNAFTCALSLLGTYRSTTSVTTGYWYNSLTNYAMYFITTSTTSTNTININSAGSCTPSGCKTWYFRNTNILGTGLSETFTYTNCSGVSSSMTIPINTTGFDCVLASTTPPVGNRGDYPYTFDEICI